MPLASRELIISALVIAGEVMAERVPRTGSLAVVSAEGFVAEEGRELIAFALVPAKGRWPKRAENSYPAVVSAEKQVAGERQGRERQGGYHRHDRQHRPDSSENPSHRRFLLRVVGHRAQRRGAPWRRVLRV